MFQLFQIILWKTYWTWCDTVILDTNIRKASIYLDIIWSNIYCNKLWQFLKVVGWLVFSYFSFSWTDEKLSCVYICICAGARPSPLPPPWCSRPLLLCGFYHQRLCRQRLSEVAAGIEGSQVYDFVTLSWWCECVCSTFVSSLPIPESENAIPHHTSVPPTLKMQYLTARRQVQHRTCNTL